MEGSRDDRPRSSPRCCSWLLLSLPGFCHPLGEARSQSWHEAITLATAQETWLCQHRGIDDARIVPYLNGALRFVKPPLVVRSAMLAWTGLPAEVVELQTLITRAPGRGDDGTDHGRRTVLDRHDAVRRSTRRARRPVRRDDDHKALLRSLGFGERLRFEDKPGRARTRCGPAAPDGDD